jgi:carbon monoxide dehydrogenase subunit G
LPLLASDRSIVQLEHTFTVPAELKHAWQVLLDIERIAPCMPGASIDSIDGDDFTGTVKVRLGPIGLTYKGKASFIEKDETAHRAVISAQGKDARGNGTASATVTATLSARGDGTLVEVRTDLNITGKPAQFGRGVMVDVGNKLIGQFADCLAGKLSESGEPEVVTEPEPAAEPEAPSNTVDSPAAEAVEAELAGADSVSVESPLDQPTPAAAEIAAGEPVASAAAEPITAPSPRQPAHAAPAAEVEPIDLLGSAGPAVAKRLVPVAAMVLILLLILRRRRR